MGIANAAVLPVPVRACPTTSCSSSANGIKRGLDRCRFLIIGRLQCRQHLRRQIERRQIHRLLAFPWMTRFVDNGSELTLSATSGRTSQTEAAAAQLQPDRIAVAPLGAGPQGPTCKGSFRAHNRPARPRQLLAAGLSRCNLSARTAERRLRGGRGLAGCLAFLRAPLASWSIA